MVSTFWEICWWSSPRILYQIKPDHWRHNKPNQRNGRNGEHNWEANCIQSNKFNNRGNESNWIETYFQQALRQKKKIYVGNYNLNGLKLYGTNGGKKISNTYICFVVKEIMYNWLFHQYKRRVVVYYWVFASTNFSNRIKTCFCFLYVFWNSSLYSMVRELLGQ